MALTEVTATAGGVVLYLLSTARDPQEEGDRPSGLGLVPLFFNNQVPFRPQQRFDGKATRMTATSPPPSPPQIRLLRVPDVTGLTVAEAALAWAAEGWPVFPCEATNHDKKKGSWAKRPHSMLRQEEADRGEGGWKLATTDLEKVRAWWEKDPKALIGIPPGLYFAVVLDADGKVGVRKLFEVADDFDLTSTVTTKTPGKGGGMHVWFNRSNRTGVIGNGGLKGVPGEARGDRGYVIVPPSELPDGGKYEFVQQPGLEEEGHTYVRELAELPDWASDLLPWETNGHTAPSIADVTKGDEQAWLMSAGAPWSDSEAKLFIAQAVAEIKTAPKGDVDRGRHPTATKLAASLLSKAQKKEMSINLMEGLSQLRDAFIEVKPEGAGDFDRFVSDAVARRVAEDRARLGSQLSIEELDIPREPPPEWDPPTLNELRGSGHKFPIELLPDVMRRMVEEVARDAQVDPALPALAALGAASAATAGGFEMRPGNTWVEGTALYLVGVAPPSERKSATLRPFVTSVSRAARSWEEATQLERARWEAEEEALKNRERDAKKVAHTPEGEKELAAIRVSIEGHKADGVRLTKPNGIIHSDPTQEALIASMATQLGVGFVASAEGAFVANLAGKYSANENDRSELGNMNSAWAREGIRSVRVSRNEAKVDTPHLTVLTLVQPYVAELLAHPSFEQSGFLSRVLYVHPRSMVGSRRTKLRGGSPYYEIARDSWDARIEALFRRGWGQISDPYILKLEPEAEAVYEQFWAECEKKAADAWWGKAHGQVLRIATLLQLVEEPAATHVTLGWVEAGIAIVRFFGEERAVMRRAVVEGDAGGVVHTEGVKRLLRHMDQRWDQIVDAGHVRVRDVSRWLRIPAHEAVALMEELVEQRWLAEANDVRGNAYRVRSDLRERLRELEQKPERENPQSVESVTEGVTESVTHDSPMVTGENGKVSNAVTLPLSDSKSEGPYSSSSSSSYIHKTSADDFSVQVSQDEPVSPASSEGDVAKVSHPSTLPEKPNGDKGNRVSREVSPSVTPIRHFLSEAVEEMLSEPDVAAALKELGAEEVKPLERQESPAGAATREKATRVTEDVQSATESYLERQTKLFEHDPESDGAHFDDPQFDPGPICLECGGPLMNGKFCPTHGAVV